MGSVTFDFAGWQLRYQEFSDVNQTVATLYFNEACLYLDNSDCSRVTDLGVRSMLLNMLTAHIAALARTEMVGRVSQAGEGSVSASADMPLPGSAAWFAQTRYGAAFWQATAQYRQARYVPGRSHAQNLGRRW